MIVSCPNQCSLGPVNLADGMNVISLPSQLLLPFRAECRQDQFERGKLTLIANFSYARQLRVIRLVLAAGLIAGSSGLQAHHSAALFYDSSERVTLTGEVARFNFRNPHAILELLVTEENGEVVRWTCETSAPSALRRRGWSQESIVAGEIVTLEGVPARDGSYLMRITRATKADGTQVGVSRSLDD